jgi:DNA-binding transcriptional MocR family regulator
MRRTARRSSPESYLYRDLARQIAEAMRTGSLRIGDRVPSVRRLSAQHSVSISTAVQALRYLENQRLIEARPKSGFFVARQPQELAEPEQSRPPLSARYFVTPSLQRDYIEALSSPGAIPLGAVLPPPSMFPGERIAKLLASASRRNPALTVSYAAYSSGADELRRVVARRALDCGVRITAGDVMITSGGIEAIMFALRAVARPGDTVALESPTHFVLLQAIAGLGMKALEIPTHPASGISVDALDLATQKRGAVRAVLLMPTFSNPLGSTIPDAQRKRLVELCAEREIPIVENDVFGEVCFEEARPRPLKAWDRSGNVLLCSSFSKTVAPGLRIGWIVPGRYQKDVELIRLSGPMFTPHIPQLALAQFVTNGGYDLHLRKLRGSLREAARKLRETVAASFPADSKVTRPRGGYVLWVELPSRIDSVELFRRARAENIALAPGPLFTSTGRFRNCIRLCFAHAWSRSIEDAVARVGRLAHELQSN